MPPSVLRAAQPRPLVTTTATSRKWTTRARKDVTAAEQAALKAVKLAKTVSSATAEADIAWSANRASRATLVRPLVSLVEEGSTARQRRANAGAARFPNSTTQKGR